MSGMRKADGWNITVNHRGARDAMSAFNAALDKQDVPLALARRLQRAAVELTVGAGDNDVAIISSGHHRPDGTGYFALSVSVAPKPVAVEVGPLEHVQV